MNIFDRPKIDGHCHVLDPVRFPYPAEVPYHPQGQEIGTADYYTHVMDAYGTRHALLVGPNSGYGLDNRCLLDAIAQGGNRFKGIAVVRADISKQALKDLQTQGIVGIAFNTSFHGLDYYADIDPLLALLRELDMWAQFQVSANQLEALWPRIQRIGVKTMIDHCGRPNLADGPNAPGLQALWKLADSGLGVGVKGYTAVYVLKAAIEKSGKVDRKAAAAAIRNSCFSAKQHPGILMDVCFDDKGDIDRESFITEIRNGKTVVAETLPPLNKK